MSRPANPPIDAPDDPWNSIDVLALVTLDQLDTLLFRSVVNQRNVNGVLYGGQVIAQALSAACATVEPDRRCNSLHAYFLRGGASDRPVIYQVDKTRNGGSFSTRKVTAIQKGVPILEMLCSFHRGEDGFDHQRMAPDVPLPEVLPTMADLIAAHPEQLAFYTRYRSGELGPIDLRPVDPRQLFERLDEPVRRVWLRAPAAAGTDDPVVHQQILTYLSDFWLSGVAMNIHTETVPGNGYSIASLDHALWFHRAVRADDWLLYDTTSPSASNGRGLSRGHLYDRTGALVATVMQEALIRKARGTH
ncbi:acyl-CoA thioesterase II [soil metagenome]